MRLYLDDDLASPLLLRLLTQAGHDVIRPVDVGKVGADDVVHLTVAIGEDRAMLSGNHDDYHKLHDLVMRAAGHHSGILIVRRDNDPRRDMSPRAIVNAIAKLLAAGVPVADEFIILNHWR